MNIKSQLRKETGHNIYPQITEQGGMHSKIDCLLRTVYYWDKELITECKSTLLQWILFSSVGTFAFGSQTVLMKEATCGFMSWHNTIFLLQTSTLNSTDRGDSFLSQRRRDKRIGKGEQERATLVSFLLRRFRALTTTPLPSPWV